MSDDEDTIEFVPFSQRSEWKDVIPIKQDDGPNPVCPIAYSPEFSETMDYFRAILHKDEYSQRAYDLTTEVLQLNAAFYTAWYFRRLVIDALQLDWKNELEYITELGNKNPKNYQIWYHRKVCVEKCGDFSKEIQFTADQIEDDSKNYHAWAHRQWVVESKELWESELEYIDKLLADDVRNNSAWNQRYFVITHNKKISITKEIIEREIEFAFAYIKKAPNNQSPWVYLKGLFNDIPYSTVPTFKGTLQEFASKYITCSHVHSLLVEILEQENTKESLEQAVKLIDDLEKHQDTTHRKYWAFRKQQLAKRL